MELEAGLRGWQQTCIRCQNIIIHSPEWEAEFKREKGNQVAGVFVFTHLQFTALDYWTLVGVCKRVLCCNN